VSVATADVLKAPYPWAGGKARVSSMVWQRLGNPDNFIEPFMGSLAVMLRRPAEHFKSGYRVETCNDLNHFVVNAWRAIQRDPEQVAKWADSPVFEADLHARHKWLMRSQHAADYRRWMAEDPEHYDAKVAGWWIWGACCWIGGAWCNDVRTEYSQMPYVSRPGYGVNAGGPTDWVQPPHMDAGGRGHHGRPQLADAFDIGRGVNSGGNLSTQVPLISGPGDGVNSVAGRGTCSARRSWLIDWMTRLADRLRLVRTCYGHWSRICDSDSTLTRLGTTGVFLDPPYPSHRADTGEKSRDASLYATDNGADLNALRDEVLAWCRKWGKNKMIRVAVCCYEGDGYEPLEAEGWKVESWEASGGYGNQSKKGSGKATNAKRERIYFSPHCLNPQPDLFAEV
jgi:hypothetical protein